MGASKNVFISMREEEYNLIPYEIKEMYFNSKNVTKEIDDFDENMKDSLFCELYKQKRKISKQLEERAYQLREQRRRKNEISDNNKRS